MSRARPWGIVCLLAVTQIASWGSLYYAFAVIAGDIQRELGWSSEIIFGAFSWSLLVSGVAATPAGILIDRHGGRVVMGCGSLLGAAGMAALGLAHSLTLYFVGWTLVGAAMAMVLYEAAFATLNREFATGARKAISVLSLFGGLASTVFWPLTLKLNGAFGWRNTLFIFAAMHLLLCLPLHGLLPAGARRAAPARMPTARDYTLHEALRDPVFWKLAAAFAANLFIFSALSVHLIPLLQRFGHSAATAVLVSSLIGPMQVAGRIGEMTFAARLSPQTVGKLSFAVLPPALLVLLFLGTQQVAVVAFCVLYGISNGILTIVRGTVPQALFGRENYGAIVGALAGPSLIAKAAGPLVAAAFIGVSASSAWLLSVLLGMSLASLACFLAAAKSQRTAAALAD